MNSSTLRARFVIPLFLAFVAGSSNFRGTSSPRAAAAAPPYKITAVKAMLFYNERGTFSRDILAEPKFTLWNTIIGEGDAEGASRSTLVLVEVTGKSSTDEAAPPRKVEFTATAAGKVLLKKTYDVALGEGGKFYAPFWLYDPGCEHIRISARITGQAQASAMTKTLPFECGE